MDDLRLLAACHPERDFFINNLLVLIHFIVVMMRWTGLAPWETEFSVPDSGSSTFLLCPPPSLEEGLRVEVGAEELTYAPSPELCPKQ